jgi:hypothetical protein
MTRQRIRKTTTSLANGTAVVRTKLVAAEPAEWECQAEAVRRLRQLPGYGDEAGPGIYWTFAADFNAARRSRQESIKAKATGIKAGEQDIRVYAFGQHVLLLELKGPKTPVSGEQKTRHALHRHLGFRVEIIRCKTIEQGAADVVALVQGWLAECGAGERGGAGVSTQAATHVASDNESPPAGLAVAVAENDNEVKPKRRRKQA